MPNANEVSDLTALLRELRPTLNPGTYAFCTLPAGQGIDLPAIGTFAEPEGLTVIVEENLAAAHGLIPTFRAAWITLRVRSDLSAVGLTAAVARELAAAGIACNVVAAAHHDHL